MTVYITRRAKNKPPVVEQVQPKDGDADVTKTESVKVNEPAKLAYTEVKETGIIFIFFTSLLRELTYMLTNLYIWVKYPASFPQHGFHRSIFGLVCGEFFPDCDCS